MTAGAYGAREPARLLPEVLRHDELVQRAAMSFRRRIAEHSSELAVDADHALPQVDHDDGFGCALEQLVEQRGLHAQTCFGLLAPAQLAQHQPHQQ